MTRKILLASHEESVAALVVTVLTRAGYEVSTVKNGSQAVSALLAVDSDYAMVILDGQLPPVSGNRVVSVLREKGCRVPVMLASGSFVFDGLPTGDPGVALLTKPFLPEDLLQTVDELLKS